MATTVATLIKQVRRYTRDYPELDASTASISNSATTLSVADTTKYAVNQTIQLETEAMVVRALPSGTTLTVFRGAAGSTAASHATSTVIMQKPGFLDIEYLDALNYALSQTYPYLYKEVADTSLTTLADTYEYTIPNETTSALPIRAISRVELDDFGGGVFTRTRFWRVDRGATPKIAFLKVPDTGCVIRIHGYSHFTALTLTGSLDTKFPVEAVETLVLGAAEYLTASGETGRVRTDVGMIDNRESANRVGSSLQVSNALYSRFERSLLKHAMPALPKNVQRVY